MGTLCVPCLHRLPPSARPVRRPARFYYHLDTRDDDIDDAAHLDDEAHRSQDAER